MCVVGWVVYVVVGISYLSFHHTHIGLDIYTDITVWCRFYISPDAFAIVIKGNKTNAGFIWILLSDPHLVCLKSTYNCCNDDNNELSNGGDPWLCRTSYDIPHGEDRGDACPRGPGVGPLPLTHTLQGDTSLGSHTQVQGTGPTTTTTPSWSLPGRMSCKYTNFLPRIFIYSTIIKINIIVWQ